MAREMGDTNELDHLRRRNAELVGMLAMAGSESYFRSILDDMFEGLQIIDFERRYVYLNKTAAEQGRYPREELVGKKMIDAYPGMESTEIYRLIEECLDTREPRQVINEFTYPDGQTGWFDLRLDPIPAGVLILSIDVTEHRNTELQLHKSQEHLAATLQCMEEAVITTGLDGRIIRMNAAAEKFTGWPFVESIGRRLADVVRLLDRNGQPIEGSPVEAILTRGLKYGTADRIMLASRDGKRRPVTARGSPVRDGAGELHGIVLVIEDITDEANLSAMLQQAQKMEAVGQLAGGVAHDFNNLLSVILGYSTLLLERMEPDAPARKQVERIHTAGESAKSLTRQLLAFSRKQVLQPRIVDLNQIAKETHDLVARLIGEHIQVNLDLTPTIGKIEVDPGQLSQVIMNLAVNARDAMPRGGTLSIATRDVYLDESYAATHPEARVGHHVMVSVSDTGEGMNEATLAHLFEPFFTTKPKGKGTGLGLSTVFGIVKQSGGNIWVYSEVGRGTTFKIYFPRAYGNGEQPLTTPRFDTSALAGRRILLVEDQTAVRELLAEVMELAGYEVVDAADTDAALAAFSGRTGDFDLLLTDVVVPSVGGVELAKSLGAQCPQMRVVFMSGYTDDTVFRGGVIDRSVTFIEKPILPDALLQKIREVLTTK